MTALVSTEWRKLLTTRGPLAALAGLLVLSVAIAIGGMGDIGSGTATKSEDARELLVVGAGLFASLVLLVLGTLAATGEFQHRTAVTTYLITPLRGRVLAAKLVAHAIVGALVSAVLAAVTFPIVLVMAHGQDVHVASTAGIAGAAAAVVAAGALSSVLGVAAGSILRNQTTALLVVLLWMLVAERFLFSPLPAVFPFGGLLSGMGLTGDNGPGALQGLAVAFAWAASLVALARWRFIGRDVT
jgi:hypothetical protein